MKTRHKARFDLDLLTSKFEKIKKHTDKGISFNGFEFDDYISILESAYEFVKNIPFCERKLILNKALFACGKKGIINTRNLLKEIKIAENNFLSLPLTKYKLVTSISVQYSPLLKPIRIQNCHIQFFNQLPKHYNQSIILEKLNGKASDIIPLDYTVIVITTKGRTTFEAVEKGLDAFEFIRGIWNYLNNSAIFRRKQTGKQRPINQILLGPIHTLHNLDGSAATDDHWYEILFSSENSAQNINKNLSSILKQEKYLRKHLKRISYGDELSKLFLRYNDTLDIIDYSSSLISLWSILEYLTDTMEKTYDQTISRATFMYDDYSLVRQYLESIRDVRNKIVHTL